MELHNKSGQNDDDDDEGFGELYENGHWEWDEQSDGLLYVRLVYISMTLSLGGN